MSGHGQQWTHACLTAEAAGLVLWAAASTHPKALPVAITGVGISVNVDASLADHPGRHAFYGTALLLHRCMLCYVPASADWFASLQAVPALARLLWVVLATSGLAHVAAVSAILQPRSLRLLGARQVAAALLLCRRAHAICAAVESQQLLSGQAQRWLCTGASPSAAATGALPCCHSFVLALVVACVIIVPVSVAWLCWQGGGRARPRHDARAQRE